MKIIISGENLEIDGKMEKLIFDKFSSLEKILADLNEEEVARIKVMKDNRWGYRFSFDMGLPRKVKIYSETKNKDLLFGLADLKNQVEKQIKKYKEKLKRK